MVDNFLRGLVDKEWKIGKNGKYKVAFLDILLVVFATVFACCIRFALRDVVAGDYKVFFEPWVATLREAGGGFKGISVIVVPVFEVVYEVGLYALILIFITVLFLPKFYKMKYSLFHIIKFITYINRIVKNIA